MTVTVDRAGEDDAAGIVRVWVEGWRWAYEGIVPASYLARLSPDDPERIRLRRERLVDQAHGGIGYSLVAREDAEVIGFAQVGPRRIDQGADQRNTAGRADRRNTVGGADRRNTVADDEGEVYALYVAPARVGSGVGRALMDVAVTLLRERRLDPIRLWVLEGNVRARRFYERYGFRLDGDRSTFTLEEPGKLPVDLPEVRYTLGLG